MRISLVIVGLLSSAGYDAKTVFDQGLQGIQDEGLINIYTVIVHLISAPYLPINARVKYYKLSDHCWSEL